MNSNNERLRAALEAAEAALRTVSLEAMGDGPMDEAAVRNFNDAAEMTRGWLNALDLGRWPGRTVSPQCQ
jgi:hypothetical protein